jgi:schlafen family protein
MATDGLNGNTLPTDRILPWTPSQLEEILRAAIDHGIEGAKIDMKVEIETGSGDHKSDLLTDITAMANTYAAVLLDYGFLVYGVKGKDIVGIKKTEPDKLQNQIEQLLRSYIAPLPEIYVTSFTDTDATWGVVVIPPRDNRPYMFWKDVQCQDPKRARRKGDWFVRRGATTDRGLPEDLLLINQKQTALLLDPLRDSVRNLQVRLGKVEDQYNSALFQLLERTATNLSGSSTDSRTAAGALSDGVGEALGLDLPTRFKHRLRTPNDGLAADLLAEARNLRDFLASSTPELPWNPHLKDPAANKELLENLERRTRAIQLVSAEILLSKKGPAFADALIRSIKTLATEVQAPSGVPFNTFGEGLRFYPLGLILYTVFTCGVAARRGDLLKRILALELATPERGKRLPLTEALFRLHYAWEFFNNALGTKSCEPIGERIRQVLNDSLTELTVDLLEPEVFFQGEFSMALAHLDARITKKADPAYIAPAPGLYVYRHEAHTPIIDLVSDPARWLQCLYSNPLNILLAAFDGTFKHIVNPLCPFARFPALAIYEQSPPSP